MRVFMAILCSLLAVCSVSAQISRQEGTDRQAAIYRLPLLERAFLCTRYFEGWHDQSTYPYVGWGIVCSRGKVFGTHHDETAGGRAPAERPAEVHRHVPQVRGVIRFCLARWLSMSVRTEAFGGGNGYPKAR